MQNHDRAGSPTASSWLLRVGVSLLGLFLLVALLGPWITPVDPARLDLLHRLTPPHFDAVSAAHGYLRIPAGLLGSDELGRDVLARLMDGTRVSLAVAVVVVAVSAIFGVLLGLLAGFYGGVIDTIVNLYLTTAFLALPGILLAVALVAFLGPSLPNLILALALPGWVNYCRLVRAQVMSLKQREFVQAARSLGATDARLILRHILPNITGPVFVQAIAGLSQAVMAEATLSFLGLGVQPPTPTWGAMLNAARSHLFDTPLLALWPAAALATLVLAFNLVGDGLRDRLDPRAA